MKQGSQGIAKPLGHSRKKLDLTGQRFGKLTVLGPAENIGRRTAWLCRCDCGRETIVKTYRLRSGHTSSCGCSASRETPLGLTYVDGTCVEMIQAKTVRRDNMHMQMYALLKPKPAPREKKFSAGIGINKGLMIPRYESLSL